MHFLFSKMMVKLLIGLAAVVAAVGIYTQPSQDTPCTTISNFPGRSAVYECKPGLSTVLFRDSEKIAIFATLTADHQAQAWLTHAGDSETVKTIHRLGPAVVLAPGAFMAVSTPAQGEALAYVLAKTTVLLTVVMDVPATK